MGSDSPFSSPHNRTTLKTLKQYKAMHKHFSFIYLLLASFVIGLTGCSDDLTWNNQINSEEEIALAFRTSAEEETEVLTRAIAEPNTSVNSLELLIFDASQNLTHYQKFTSSDFINGTASDTKAIKISRTKAVAGNWYLVANAGTLVSGFVNPDANGNFTGLKKETDFVKITLPKADLIGASAKSPTILVAKANIQSIPAVTVPVLPTTFSLERRMAKIRFKVDSKLKKFLVTGVKLWHEPSTVGIDGTPATTTVYSSTFTNTPLNSSTDGKKHLKSTDALEFYTLPIGNTMEEKGSGTNKQYKDARLIIKGYYFSNYDQETNTYSFEDSEEKCLAYEFPSKVNANHSYTLTLTDVTSDGVSEQDAVANPTQAVVKYEDSYDVVKNMVTDGVRAIALPDTLSVTKDTWTYQFTVTWRGYADDVLEAKFDGGEAPSWATLTAGTTTIVDGTEDEDAQNLIRKQSIYNLRVSENLGTDRSCDILFSIKDVDMQARFVCVQGAPASVNLDSDLDVKLTVSRGSSSKTITNYLAFIGNSTETSTETLYGLAAEENGGRVRNAGLHIPMHNHADGSSLTYKYEITAPSGWSLQNNVSGVTATKSGNTWTITFTDTKNPLSSSDPDGYMIFEDALEFSNSDKTKTLSLDLYHTGFFQEESSTSHNWYYYEVFKVGNQLWLDRNVGAKSAGMAHRTSSLLSGEWPLADGCQGDWKTFVQAENGTGAPAGWRLPSQGDFETLTAQQNFASERTTIGGSTIFIPSYRFVATTIRKNGSTAQSNIRAYFPHNRYQENSAIDGDEGAGYYWTNTNTDNASYYRSMKFIGQNVTVENMLTSRGLSMRCVSGDEVSSTTRYSCVTKGYTHAFLYHKNADGVKTFLTTWPGVQVATIAMADARYNVFEYESFVNYPANELYIIFNRIDGSTQESNVSTRAVTAREGIPFKAGKAYNRGATPTLVYNWGGSNIVTKGNWEDEPEIPVERVIGVRWKVVSGKSKNRINITKGGSPVNDEKDWNSNWAKDFSSGDGTYNLATIKGEDASTAISNIVEKLYFKNDQSDGAEIKYETTSDVQNMLKRVNTIPTTGKYNGLTELWEIEFDGGGGGDTSTYTFKIKGSILSTDSNTWNFSDELNAANNYTLTITTKSNYNFGIQGYKDGNEYKWYNSSTVTLDYSGGSLSTDQGNWKGLPIGTYTFKLDVNDNHEPTKLTITGTGGGGGTKYLVIRVPDGEISQNYIHVWNGSTSYTNYGSAPKAESSTLNGYKYWKINLDGKAAPTTLSGILFKNNASGDDGKTQYDDSDYWKRVTDSDQLAAFGAEAMFTFSLYRYEFRGEIFGGNWSDKTTSYDGTYWYFDKTYCTGNKVFGIKKIKIGGDQVAWVQPANSSDVTVVLNKEIDCAYEGSGGAGNFKISTTMNLTMHFDPARMILIVKKAD